MAFLVASFAMSALAQDQDEMAKETESRRQQVADALDRLPRFPGPFDYVTFSISGTEVTLEGFSTRPTIKSDAQKVVERIDWVTKVDNEIDFNPSEPGTDRIREDTLAVLVDVLPDAFSEKYPDLRIKVDPEFNVTIVGELSPINRGRYESALVRVDQVPLVKSVDSQVTFKKER